MSEIIFFTCGSCFLPTVRGIEKPDKMSRLEKSASVECLSDRFSAYDVWAPACLHDTESRPPAAV